MSSLIQASEISSPGEGSNPLLGDPGEDEAHAAEVGTDGTDETEETDETDGTDGTLLTVNVDGYDIAGIISIPAIAVELAVISQWSYPNLEISACRYSGTPSGRLVLLAHNFKRHFGRINELQPGDAVVFTEPNGTVYNYEVTGTEIKGKYELQDILSGDWDLTLFTCTYGGANRVVVRCERTASNRLVTP